MRQNWQMWSAAIGNDTINKIIREAQTVEPVAATIFSDDDRVNNEKIRRSEIRWITHNKFVKDLLWQYVEEANRVAFGFDINNICDIQYTEYLDINKGHYHWHHDIDWVKDNAFDRKLSVTVQLSDPQDYKGGEFEFSEVPNPDTALSKQKGTVLVFPSYLQHRVFPITQGKRVSLVAWFEGPRWR